MPFGQLITADKCISSCNCGKKITIVKIFQKVCRLEPDLSNIEIVGLDFVS